MPRYSSRSVRILLFAFLILLVAVPAMAAGSPSQWVSLTQSTTPGQQAQIEVLSSDQYHTSYRVEIPGFYVKETIEAGMVFQEITLPGYATTTAIGQPAMPVIRKAVAIPYNTGAVVEVTEQDVTVLSGFNVFPFQTPLYDGQERESFDYDASFYKAGGMMPENTTAISKPMIWKELRLAAASFYPMHFDPATGDLQVASSAIVTVIHKGKDATNALPAPVNRVSPHMVNSYRSIVLNYDSLKLQAVETDAGIDYLMICKPGYDTLVQSLADWHAANGKSVSVVTTATTGATDTAIKAYIQTEYDSGAGDLDYVLFVGDVDVVPWHNYSYDTWGDFWFSQLDGDDFFSEIAMGRIPAKTDAEVTNVVNKTLAWLNDENPGSWQSKSTLIAHNEYYPDKYTECSETIRTHTYEWDPPIFDTVYGGAPDPDPNLNEDVTANLEEGRFLVNYRGHGDTDCWIGWDHDDASYTNAMVGTLSNGNYTPVIYSIACNNAELQSVSKTFSEAWMFADYGSVAFLGATEPSYTYPNHDFDRFLYRATYDDSITPIGDVLIAANNNLWVYWTEVEENPSLAEANINIYLWLGDPAIELPLSGLLSPNNVSATALSCSEVRITWSDRTDDEDGFILERLIGEEESSEDADWEVLGTLDPDVEIYNDTGLSEATVVSYRLQTLKGSETSRYTDTATTATLPLAPTDLASQATDTNQIDLTWTDNSAAESGYTVERKLGGEADFTQIDLLAGDIAEYEDDSLDECTQATYRVTAVTIGGASDPSNTVTDTSLPYAPSDPDWQPVSDSSVSVSWSDNSSGEVGFIVQRAPYGSEDFQNVGSVDADLTVFTDTGLSEATEYSYRMMAYNAGGNSEASGEVVAETLPAAPSLLESEDISSTQVDLTWSDNSNGETGYTVQRKLDGDFSDLANVHADATLFTDASLSECSAPVYRVKAFSQIGDSEYSEEVTGFTKPSGPSALTADAEGTSSIRLTWEDVSSCEDGYKVYRAKQGQEYELADTLEASSFIYSDEGLESGTTYNYYVAATFGEAESDASDIVAATTDEEGDDDDDDCGF